MGRAWGGDASGRDRGRGSVLGPGEDRFSGWGQSLSVFWTHRDRQDGFPPATSPWAASGLERGTGERGKEMLEPFTLLSGASPSFLPLSLSSDPDSFPGSGSLLAQSLDFNPPIPANVSTDLSSRPFPTPSADPVLLLPPDPRTPLSYPEFLLPRAPRKRAGPPLNAFCLPPSFFLGLSQYLCFLPYRR